MSGDLKMSGVYRIRQKNTGRVYIGATMSSLGQRWAYHIGLLLGSKHENKPMQQDFDRYGLTSFAFEVIELMPFATEIELRESESHQIRLARENGECYNARLASQDSEQGINKLMCVFCSNPAYDKHMCQEHLYIARQGLPRYLRRLITKNSQV